MLSPGTQIPGSTFWLHKPRKWINFGPPKPEPISRTGVHKKSSTLANFLAPAGEILARSPCAQSDPGLSENPSIWSPLATLKALDVAELALSAAAAGCVFCSQLFRFRLCSTQIGIGSPGLAWLWTTAKHQHIHPSLRNSECAQILFGPPNETPW